MKMKLHLVILLIFTVNLCTAQQYSIEGRFMPGYHRTTGEEAISHERFQNNGGIFLKRSLNDNFGLITGLNTRILNYHRNDDIYNHKQEFLFNYDQQIRFEYLELPINCYYSYKNFFIEGGINLNYLVDFYGKVNETIISSTKPDNMTFLPGLNANIGYQINIGKHFYANIAVFYDYPVFVQSFFKSDLMNYGAFVGLGYQFTKQKK